MAAVIWQPQENSGWEAEKKGHRVQKIIFLHTSGFRLVSSRCFTCVGSVVFQYEPSCSSRSRAPIGARSKYVIREIH